MTVELNEDGCLVADVGEPCDPDELECKPLVCPDRYQVAWMLQFAARNALSCVEGFDVECLQAEFVTLGIPQIPPQCCDALGVGILPPIARVVDEGSRTRGQAADCLASPPANRYAIVITSCKPDVSDGAFSWGDPSGSDPKSYSGATLQLMIRYHAILGGINDAWCCQVKESGCCDCASLKVVEIRDHQSQTGSCMGWEFIVEAR